ncbi:MAG: hypothetical protein MUE74_03805 [Bacteroidales bacterium]|nr:hypothetical protein [Bacteroidales bacterium]
MDFSKTLDLIVRDLQEALEIIDDFRNYPDVPAIQVELAKAKCRNAAEVIALLKTTPFAATSGEPSVARKAAEAERRRKTEAGSKGTEAGSKKTEAGSTKTEAGSTKKEVEENAEIIHQAGILADTFGTVSDSLNEKLGGLRADDNVPDYLRGKPLTSLKEAIGINDRFLFIRELFGGNAESYSLAISKLDEASCLSDARALFTDFTHGKAESEAAKQLFDLVKRKYPGDE